MHKMWLQAEPSVPALQSVARCAYGHGSCTSPSLLAAHRLAYTCPAFLRPCKSGSAQAQALYLSLYLRRSRGSFSSLEAFAVVNRSSSQKGRDRESSIRTRPSRGPSTPPLVSLDAPLSTGAQVARVSCFVLAAGTQLLPPSAGNDAFTMRHSRTLANPCPTPTARWGLRCQCQLTIAFSCCIVSDRSVSVPGRRPDPDRSI